MTGEPGMPPFRVMVQTRLQAPPALVTAYTFPSVSAAMTMPLTSATGVARMEMEPLPKLHVARPVALLYQAQMVQGAAFKNTATSLPVRTGVVKGP